MSDFSNTSSSDSFTQENYSGKTTLPIKTSRNRKMKKYMPLVVFILIILGIYSLIQYVSSHHDLFSNKQSNISPTDSPSDGELLFPTTNKNLAKVGSYTITMQDLDIYMRLNQGSFRIIKGLKNAEKKQLLEELIKQTLIEQEAKRMSLVVSPEEVNRERALVQQELGSEDRFETMLKANGWTEEDEKKRLYTFLLTNKFKEKIVAWKMIDGVHTSKNPEGNNFLAEVALAKKTMMKIKAYFLEGLSVDEAVIRTKKDETLDPNISVLSHVTITKDSKLDPSFVSAVLKGHTGIVTDVYEYGGSLLMGKIINENNSSYQTFDQWVTIMKQKYVTYL